MKPSKRIYCRECGREKIVFETEKKALNFIKWNADEIESESGRRPVRAYYCDCCGGYHVTSMACFKRPNCRTNRVLKAYHNMTSILEVSEK